jgi:hypothetical protein
MRKVTDHLNGRTGPRRRVASFKTGEYPFRVLSARFNIEHWTLLVREKTIGNKALGLPWIDLILEFKAP